MLLFPLPVPPLESNLQIKINRVLDRDVEHVA
jgi:hypothetical protein